MRRAFVMAAFAVVLVGAAGPLRVETLEGEAVALALQPGERALLVHFWASWCPECVEELPRLAAAVGRCRQGGVRIVTVNVGEAPETVSHHLVRHGPGLPALRDPAGRAWRSLGGVGLPANATETRAGRAVAFGARSAAVWAAELAALGCPPLSP